MKSIDQLAEEISVLSAHIQAATCQWLLLVAEFDRREGWGHWGFKTAAHFLSWRCSISPGAAREHVRVARRLSQLPAVTAAFSRGELSYSKVRALTRIEGVEREEELLELARVATASELDRMVRAYRGVVAVEAGAERARERRFADWDFDDDGALVLRARLPAEEGAILLAALRSAVDEVTQERRDACPSASTRDGDASAVEPRPEERDPARFPSVSKADALLRLADRALAGDRVRTNGDRYQVVLHVDEAALARPDGGALGVLDAGEAVPPETTRRVCCDSSLVRISERDGRPLSIGRKRRTIPPSIRRALHRRDGGCRFPGCTKRHWVDAHHIRHWVNGGETSMDNLVLLCWHHHRLVHEGGYSVERGGRSEYDLIFRRPDGTRLHRVVRQPHGEAGRLAAEHDRRCLRIGPETGVPLSDGRPMQLHACVAALLTFAPPGSAPRPVMNAIAARR